MIVKKEKTEALADAAERAQMQGSSLWDDAWRRFRKNRAAVYSVTILALITLFVIFAPMLTHYAYDFNDWDALSAPPSARHFLGTDSLGRDLLSRAAVGGRISLLVGLSGALVAVVIGTLYGALAGFFGGKIDSLMMRFLEILNAFPFMLFVILLTTFFGRSLILIFAAVGLVSWLDVARIVRGQTLSLKHKEFVEAAGERHVAAPDRGAPHHPQRAGGGDGVCLAAGARHDHVRILPQLPGAGRAGADGQLGLDAAGRGAHHRDGPLAAAGARLLPGGNAVLLQLPG